MDNKLNPKASMPTGGTGNTLNSVPDNGNTTDHPENSTSEQTSVNQIFIGFQNKTARFKQLHEEYQTLHRKVKACKKNTGRLCVECRQLFQEIKGKTAEMDGITEMLESMRDQIKVKVAEQEKRVADLKDQKERASDLLHLILLTESLRRFLGGNANNSDQENG